MIRKVTTVSELPEYHDGLLIVKVRPAVAGVSFASLTRERALGMRESPGLSALAAFERSGLIKRVVSLSRRPEIETPALGSLSSIASFARSAEHAESASTDPSAGVSLLELERDQDLADMRDALAADPGVEYVSRVPVRYLAIPTRSRTTNSAKPVPPPGSEGVVALATPPMASSLWNLRKINWEQARATANFKDATNVRVAVLDTGIDRNHPDLAARVVNYTFQHPDISVPVGEKDIVGHGTHVAGTIGAIINNKVGINGICECNLNAWKIFGDNAVFASQKEGFVYFVDPFMYRRALADCLDEGIDVINLSIGGRGKPDPQERQLFNSLLSSGTTIVAAMGNERQFGSPTSYPAAIPGVISVGATGADDRVAIFSNRGGHISLCAPGVGIWSTLPTYPGQTGFEAVLDANGQPREGKPFRRETHYDSWDGTSMASPHVAAAVALLIAKHGQMSPGDVRQSLTQAADKVPAMGGNDFDQDYGQGRLNLLRLLN
jgi:subtilisin family serine protease